MNDCARTDPAIEAANALVTANLAIVGYVVSDFVGRIPRHIDRADLASAGYLALVKASRSYKESTGVPFAAYANMRVRGAILDELRGMDWISRGARRRVKSLDVVREELTAELGRVPSREELSAVLGVPVSSIEAAELTEQTKMFSIDAHYGAIAEMVVDHSPTPEDRLLNQERTLFLRAGVEVLPTRMRHVIEGTFFHDTSDTDMAEELGITQSRVSQIRTEALALLRDGMNTALDPDLVCEPERPNGVQHRRRLSYFAALAAQASSASSASLVTASAGRQPEATVVDRTSASAPARVAA